MPRYFFHLKADTGTVVDDEGLFLNDINRARSGILQIVGEILSERGFDQVDICGQSLEIADETGEYEVGDLVFLDPRSVHAPRAIGDTLVLVLWPEGVRLVD